MNVNPAIEPNEAASTACATDVVEAELHRIVLNPAARTDWIARLRMKNAIRPDLSPAPVAIVDGVDPKSAISARKHDPSGLDQWRSAILDPEDLAAAGSTCVARSDNREPLFA
jgi:hypothetical protein